MASTRIDLRFGKKTFTSEARLLGALKRQGAADSELLYDKGGKPKSLRVLWGDTKQTVVYGIKDGVIVDLEYDFDPTGTFKPTGVSA